MKTLNSWWLVRLTGPFTELLEGVPIDLQPFDSESESDWKRFFQKYFVSAFRSAHPRSQEEMKRVFHFMLNKPGPDIETYYWLHNPDVAISREVLNRKLFVWLWEVLFPGEQYEMHDAGEYVDVADPSVVATYYDAIEYEP